MFCSFSRIPEKVSVQKARFPAGTVAEKAATEERHRPTMVVGKMRSSVPVGFADGSPTTKDSERHPFGCLFC